MTVKPCPKSVHKVVGFDWVLLVSIGNVDYVLGYLAGRGWKVEAFQVQEASAWMHPKNLNSDFKWHLEVSLLHQEYNDFIREHADTAPSLQSPFWRTFW